MPTLICIVPVCPVRQLASHRSEQVSQLLFGETCEIIDEEIDFVKVFCLFDGYVGWCQRSQLSTNTILPNDKQKLLASGWVNEISCNGMPMFIPFGSDVSFFTKDSLQLGNQLFLYKGKWQNGHDNLISEENLKEVTNVFLNAPYQWGGRSIFGIDCSGFTQMTYKYFGFSLLRDASLQAGQGQLIGFLQEAKCGDLAFFDNEDGNITHVGILLNAHSIIHASGKVRVDVIDNEGIVNDDGIRTHKLRIIKRVLDY